MTHNLFERVLKTIRNYEMLEDGDTVLVAVSGGSDSVFLLRALNHLKTKLKIKKLVVCNLDHGLRGQESKEDSFFVRKIAEDLDLNFIHKRINLSEKKSKDLSTEEIARKERYLFFKNAARAAKANVIATGHTLDDQAETIMMRLIKGASLKGMVGISPVRGEGDLKIIRPLFELEKREIEKYLDERGVAYRVDNSNLEPIYFRNVVRKEILPYLEKYNPRFKRALCSMAEHLREDFEFIAEAKSSVQGLAARGRGDKIEVRLKDIVMQPRALQKEILRDCLDKAGGEVKRLNFRHWKELERLIKDKSKGSALDLPGDIRIARTATSLILSKRP
ncbi:MAG: tRNA lysidine(34) synthetase TilS [Candidatus Omnitrophica bacterium]|nr:tRNA lysidine(34) synthetase TilS [Candidatus Omnitrophota bacterium]